MPAVNALMSSIPDASVRDSQADAVFETAESGVELDEFSLKKFLFYRTSKFAIVHVW